MNHSSDSNNRNTEQSRPFFTYNPNFCQAIKARFNDAKAYGKIHLDYIKTVILAGVKS